MRKLNDREQQIINCIIAGIDTTAQIAEEIFGDNCIKADSNKISQLLHYLCKDNVIESELIPGNRGAKRYKLMTQDNLLDKSKNEVIANSIEEAFSTLREAIAKRQAINNKEAKLKLLEEMVLTSNSERAQIFSAIINDLNLSVYL